MRKALLVLLLALAFDASAQSTARPRPPGTSPLEAPPPLPTTDVTREPRPDDKRDSALEPQVTVRMEGDQKIEEYRVNGKLYMMRVTPKSGPSYVLMDQKGDGTFSKHDNPLDSGVRVPQWVLLTF